MSVRSSWLTLALIALFGIQAEAWQLEQIAVDGIHPHAMFGGSINVDGSDLIVGSRNDNQKSNNAGAAYIYRYDGVQWNEEAKLIASDSTAEALMGWSVAIDGDAAVAGAWLADTYVEDAGASYQTFGECIDTA